MYQNFNNYCNTIAITDNKRYTYSNICNDCDIDPNTLTISCSRSAKSFSDPKIWGGKAWDFLDSIANGYSDNPTPEEQQACLEFFSNLHFCLPCQKCGIHFVDNLDKCPIRYSSKTELKKWLSEFHDIVNEMLGKPKYNK